MKKPQGQVYNVRIQHFYLKEERTEQMVKVEEDDCDWRFLDGYELAYNWNVISYSPVMTST
jgi:hypothetical protein